MWAVFVDIDGGQTRSRPITKRLSRNLGDVPLVGVVPAPVSPIRCQLLMCAYAKKCGIDANIDRNAEIFPQFAGKTYEI